MPDEQATQPEAPITSMLLTAEQRAAFARFDGDVVLAKARAFDALMSIRDSEAARNGYLAGLVRERPALGDGNWGRTQDGSAIAKE